MTANSWLRKWMGSKAYEAAWQFQLEGKFGEHYKEINMAWMWAHVFTRTPQLAYFSMAVSRPSPTTLASICANKASRFSSTPLSDRLIQSARAAMISQSPRSSDPASSHFDQVLGAVGLH